MNRNAAPSVAQTNGYGTRRKVQSDEDRDAVQQAHQGLHQQLAADAAAGLVDCLRGRGELSVPYQPDQAIPQIAAFEQHEDHHRRNERRRAQRPDERPEPREGRKSRRRVGRHHNWPRDGSFRGLRSQILFDPFQRFLQLLDRASLARKAHVGNLRSNVGAIAGEVFDQIVHLPGQTPAGETERREHQRDDDQHGRDPTDPSLKPGDRRRQDEREQDGERERHEDGLGPVQNGDDQHAAGERQPELHEFQRVVHGRAPFLRRVAAGVALPLTWSRTDNRGELADVRVFSTEQCSTAQTPVDVRRILSRVADNSRTIRSKQMDTTTLLVIVLVVLLLGGGGGYFYRRRT